MQKLPRILSIEPLPHLTFYRWLALSTCALSAIRTSVRFDCEVPEGTPARPALIGRFHHQLMEYAATAIDDDDLAAMIEAAIARLQEEVTRWPALRRAGSVSGWDEINRSASAARHALIEKRRDPDGWTGRAEASLSSKDRLLVGKPDFFAIRGREARLREYKSGEIRDDSGAVRQAYIDQVHFYSALIFETFDVDGVRARLESLDGDRVELAIELRGAQDVASRARLALSGINDRIVAGATATELATPSAEACAYCDLRMICGPFREAQFRLELRGDHYVLEGIATPAPTSVGGRGAALAISTKSFGRLSAVVVPAEVASEMAHGKRYVASNLRVHGGEFAWTTSARVFVCD